MIVKNLLDSPIEVVLHERKYTGTTKLMPNKSAYFGELPNPEYLEIKTSNGSVTIYMDGDDWKMKDVSDKRLVITDYIEYPPSLLVKVTDKKKLSWERHLNGISICVEYKDE